MSSRRGRLAAAVLALAAGAVAGAPDRGSSRPVAATPPVYTFEISRGFLRMKDGVRLAATFFRPAPREPGERFPVLFEFLPYRKDDSFYLRDYPIYSYFARRGFLMAKVDLRGTGSSEGVVPEREYSEAELEDAVEIIGQLARLPGTSGKVGMFGISWGGFNALQVAVRRPPALEAVLAACASDSLYQDSIDYIDGSLHVDPYHLEIHHENGLPRPPDYALDEAYFRDRFDREPWIFAYLEHQGDGPFWRKNALRWNYDALRVPVYLMGGLLDGYRDAIPRLLENARVPVRAAIGPWNHAWPDDASPGPGFEGRHEAVRFWDYWLKGRDTGIMDEPRLALFVRAGNRPDPRLATAPGEWRYEDWPIRRARALTLHPAGGHALLRAPGPAASESLRYVPSYGWAAGDWWGEATPDMRPDDAGSLVFDTPVLEQPVEIVGFPRVRLRFSVDAPLADLVARLEDVQPDGTVALVTGASLNAAQRRSPLDPEPLTPGQAEQASFDLHFTTWTFQPGHRIRLAVSNAQFPMLWPTPHPMTMTLALGPGGSALELPVVPFERRPTPAFLPPEPHEQRPDARYLECQSWPEGRLEVKRDLVRGGLSYEWAGSCGYEIGQRRFQVEERDVYQTSDARPADSSYRGDESHTIALERRTLRLETRLEVRSDETAFQVRFRRRVYEDERLVREREWSRAIPRALQ